MKVQNMTSSNGNAIPNQFNIHDGNTRIFQSYDKTIVKIKNGVAYLDEKYWNYSQTTGKYRNQFLNLTTKETEQKIKSGEFILTNLNKEI